MKNKLEVIKQNSNSELEKSVCDILLQNVDGFENEKDFFNFIWNKSYKNTSVRANKIKGLSNYAETYEFAKSNRKEIKRLYKEQGIDYKLLSKRELSIYAFEVICDGLQQKCCNYI